MCNDMSNREIYLHADFDPMGYFIYEIFLTFEELHKDDPRISKYTIKNQCYENICSLLRSLHHENHRSQFMVHKEVYILLSNDIMEFNFKHLCTYYVPEVCI